MVLYEIVHFDYSIQIDYSILIDYSIQIDYLIRIDYCNGYDGLFYTNRLS